MSYQSHPIPPFRPATPIRAQLWPWPPVLAAATLLSGLLYLAPWHLA